MLRAALTLVALTGCVTAGQPKYFCFPHATLTVHAGQGTRLTPPAPAQVDAVAEFDLPSFEGGGQQPTPMDTWAPPAFDSVAIAARCPSPLVSAAAVEVTGGGSGAPAATTVCASVPAPCASGVPSSPGAPSPAMLAGAASSGAPVGGLPSGAMVAGAVASGSQLSAAARLSVSPAPLKAAGQSEGLACTAASPPMDTVSPGPEGGWGRRSTTLGVCTEFLGVPLQGSTDIVFLLDRSSSMAEVATFADLSQQPGGEGRVDGVAIGVPSAQSGPLLPDKLTVASRELLKVLDHLPDGTRFAIGFFDDRLTWFSPGLTSLTAESRLQARRFVESVQPGGATAAMPALQGAFALHPSRVVLLSDGQPNFEGSTEQLLALAREQIRLGVRFDTVVLGAPQDGTALASLALESGGLARSY